MNIETELQSHFNCHVVKDRHAYRVVLPSGYAWFGYNDVLSRWWGECKFEGKPKAFATRNTLEDTRKALSSMVMDFDHSLALDLMGSIPVNDNPGMVTPV